MKNKNIYIVFMLLCLSVLLVACKDDKGTDKVADVESYQKNIDFNSLYENQEQINIAKSLIGKKAQEFNGSFLNGGVFDFKKSTKGKFTVLKITNQSYLSVSEDLLFKNSKEDVVPFYTVVTDLESKESKEALIEDLVLPKDNELIVTLDNVKDVESYKATYPPMYFIIDDKGYIALVLFNEQTNLDLTQLLNTYFELNIADGVNLSQEDLEAIEIGEKELKESIESGAFEEIEDYNREIMEGTLNEE